ncbi:MAG: KpsF/GutQ family sugar-phosphate isomerase, partial [Deltaproteobacteria bacterium]|nr:KpsF/GutQ family sugar-phosphate isomerase [Deltaproteobacteria bacterium]
GMVSHEDIFLALSNSGETDELNILIPSIKNVGCTVIAFTGNKDSTLAKNSDIIIDVGVGKEACPLGLAPTASTTALLAMGDALAVILINKKHFQTSDFKKIHPGGAIGQRLSGKVRDIMLTGDLIPLVSKGAPMKEAVKVVDRFKLGTALILSENETLAGIITDGDIRCFIARHTTIESSTVDDVMTINPQIAGPDTPAYDALNIMEKYQITVLPVTDNSGKICGILHLHDILGKGEFKFNGK